MSMYLKSLLPAPLRYCGSLQVLDGATMSAAKSSALIRVDYRASDILLRLDYAIVARLRLDISRHQIIQSPTSPPQRIVWSENHLCVSLTLLGLVSDMKWPEI